MIDCGNTQHPMTPETPTKPVHIYFVKQRPNVVPYRDINHPVFNLSRHTMYATNWSEMADLFRYKPESLCVNSAFLEETSLFEVTNMIDTFAKLVGMEKEISITIGVNRTTPYRLVKDAQKSRITGLIPSGTDFGLAECIKGVQAQWANIPYWPKHIVDGLDGAKKSPPKNLDNVVLTGRQQQIFEIVTTRGCSNKHIAKMMNISESTVKLHMSAILKKFGVKNRTQLAVFAKTP